MKASRSSNGTLKCVLAQGDILAKFRKDVLGQSSLLSLKHYHRPLVRSFVQLQNF